MSFDIKTTGYHLPVALQQYINRAQESKLELITPKLIPMPPIHTSVGGYYDIVYTPGPLMKSTPVLGTGKLLGIA